MNAIEDLEIEQSGEQTVEKAAEIKPEHFNQAIQMLENPPDGSFTHGLQIFVAWVKNLLALDNDK